ncbi:hypothetical protein [Natronomonas salsuginis]|jgi:hypothetical protein|uniref:Uncharacterized protein n=1 Tax=Natronomonas salsuginis TaxID=2217661 RepID=A0A4U5JC46_9EURY|nr:hypothetical protein [Natronomonas salsuginis]TKR25137.1 hypothetical protein DM868_12365 [Natronomonas salsuginis]
MIRRLLHDIGYVIAYVLFVGANTPESVVKRLRVAYRIVGVRIVETPQVDSVERTIFLCPYRNLAANWFGEKWICHDILDRVDDGYVTYLRRHKGIEYQRPRGCADLAYCDESEYCYSEVSGLE